MTDTSLGTLRQFLKLIDPCDPDEFVTSYYEQRPLYIRRDNESYFADLLNSADIDRVFQGAAIAKSVIRMTKEGKDLHSDHFTERDAASGSPLDRVSSDLILKLFGTGHTIIVNSGNRLFPNLERYCNGLEGELQFRVQPNIYITPFDARGFDTHYDDHDVFILQIMGSKAWRIFHAPVELPSRRQAHVKGTYTLKDPEMEVTLSCGDTLYIPRGVLHDASTDGVSSAHITLGLHPTCRFDLLQELTILAQERPAFRKSIPLGLLRDRDAAGREFTGLLRNLIDNLDVQELINRRQLSFVEHRRLDFRERFRDLARLNEVNLNTIVRRRTSVLYQIERNGRSLMVIFSGNRIAVQPFLEDGLASILGDDSFAVRDIKGFLSDKARVELVSTFLKAGFLEVVEWNSVE